jgi:hypothetical protein
LRYSVPTRSGSGEGRPLAFVRDGCGGTELPARAVAADDVGAGDRLSAYAHTVAQVTQCVRYATRDTSVIERSRHSLRGPACFGVNAVLLRARRRPQEHNLLRLDEPDHGHVVQVDLAVNCSDCACSTKLVGVCRKKSAVAHH